MDGFDGMIEINVCCALFELCLNYFLFVTIIFIIISLFKNVFSFLGVGGGGGCLKFIS